MGTVWGILLLIGFAAPLLLVLVGTAVAFRLTRRGQRLPTAPHPPGRPPATGVRRSLKLAGFFLATGAVVPWATGLGVKFYLDSLGRPTLPVSDFLNPGAVPVLIFQTLTLWTFPFVILASAVLVPWRIGLPRETPAREAMLPIWLAWFGGSLVAVPLFGAVFWEFDMMMLFVPLGALLLPVMALGYWAGLWVVGRRGRAAGN